MVCHSARGGVRLLAEGTRDASSSMCGAMQMLCQASVNDCSCLISWTSLPVANCSRSETLVCSHRTNAFSNDWYCSCARWLGHCSRSGCCMPRIQTVVASGRTRPYDRPSPTHPATRNCKSGIQTVLPNGREHSYADYMPALSQIGECKCRTPNT